jgi:hypothetical protein
MKNHGWIIQMKSNNRMGWSGFYDIRPFRYVTQDLTHAQVWPTRAEARSFTFDDEVVRKVRVVEGNAVEIVKGR